MWRGLLAAGLLLAGSLARGASLAPGDCRITALESAHPGAQLVLIIDDLGNHLGDGRRAVALPGHLTLSVLPHTPHGAELARQGHARGREIMLHAPMSNLGDRPLGPGALTTTQSEAEFHATLAAALDRVPHARGVNNHMGSELTQAPLQMGWLMEELKRRELYFVDSRTSAATVAAQTAARTGLPHLSRSVFLDNVRQPEAIHERYEHALNLAREHGLAVVIAHPYPETLAYLGRVLPELYLRGVRLLYVSEALASQSTYSRTSMPRSAM